MITAWTDLYSNSATLRTAVLFLHLGGLLVGGGTAVATDRLILQSAPGERSALSVLSRTHRVVVAAIASIAASGLLMLLANLDTYLTSVVYWTKMGLVALLLLNGLRVRHAESAAHTAGAVAWPRLRNAAWTSLALWMLITLFGTMLPNV